jgi:polysaccharide chain length determinant protein (PEP-CTERM system associated)
MYRSSTLILVEPQTVPQNYVAPTVASGIEERLNTLSQQILSRTNLERIIRQFHLDREPAPTAQNRLQERLKEQVKQWLAATGLYEVKESVLQPQGGISEQFLADLRQSIEVRQVGRRGNDAFTVSYSGKEPFTVMRVTNTLASLFIEENLRVRERMAEDTTEFLDEQLVAAEGELKRQEGLLREFKERRMGALPGQLDTNLRTLDRLQAELQSIEEALVSAEQNKALYEKLLLENSLGANVGTTLAPPPDPREARLASLREQLSQLRAQFKETYPDIALLKGQISELEAKSAVGNPAQEMPDQPVNTAAERVRTHLQEQLHAVQTEIMALRTRQSRVKVAIRDHEKRVDDTFGNEQKLADLTRDYEISKKNYESLLGKKLSAQLSASLEKRQKGEQFRIIDPAHLPTEPYKPERRKLILLGSVLSGGVGVGIVFLLEFLSPSGFRKPQDVQSTFAVPVLAVIPRIPRLRHKHRLITLADAESIVTEQYRILYTRIESLRRDKAQQIFAISSAIPGEGKTITTLNLAVVMARDFGRKTLVLEGDFRRPAMSSYLDTEVHSGLVDVLLNGTNGATHTPMATIPSLPFANQHLAILPAAKSVGNSSGLLSSKCMHDLLQLLKEQYEVILIDAPPVLSLSDMNIFQEVVDGIILVVRAESTRRDDVAKAVEALGREKLVGFVLNDVQQPLPRYYQYSEARR